MSFYRYQPDSSHFAGIGTPLNSGIDVVDIYDAEEPLFPIYTPILVEVFEDNPPREGDFPSLSDYCSLPVFSQRAWDALKPLIGYCCEALPIRYPEDKPYCIIHVMETIDALDVTQSQVRRRPDGRVGSVYQYAFKMNLLYGKHIFKLPRESGAGLFVDDEFRQAVEEHGLKGLVFKKLPLADARS